MQTIKIKRTCRDCGEYNGSKTSQYCTFCRDKYPHPFLKPNKELRDLRRGLAAANCHLDGCEHRLEAECPGFVWAAPVNSCGLCKGPVTDFCPGTGEQGLS